MLPDEPVVQRTGALATVRGRFFRAVTVGHDDTALAGSSRAGRYSRPDQPTLYLSSSTAGVAAAMVAHQRAGERRTVLMFNVDAAGIFDLRSRRALADARREVGDPFADWRASVAAGGEPSSWRVRAWVETRGAQGLIDPSRKAPGLWHLVLSRWNVPGSPTVLACGSPPGVQKP